MTPAPGFPYKSGVLHCEDVSFAEIAARVGTPAYIYSARAILGNYDAYTRACAAVPHTVHYSVKANGSLGVLSLLARHGAGFDIVSGGELFRVLQAGGNPAQVVFSGVGKTAEEIDYALGVGVALLSCESEAELKLVNERARRRQARAAVALRVNPDVSAETHPYVATGLREHKFGVPIGEAEDLYARAAAMESLDIQGVSCHIGSQIFDIRAFVGALRKVLDLVERLRTRGIEIRHLDLGGGLGVGYGPKDPSPAIEDYMRAISKPLEGSGLHLHLEPGRSIVARAGVLLATVLYRKRSGSKEFVIVDAAMNDLIRPALYQSYHEIVPVKQEKRPALKADIVGPVCETGDFLARDRELPLVESGDLLAVCTAGAYGFVLSSNYNARPRAAEVLVDGAGFTVIRDRETYADLIRGERTV
ncbi:MAG TPA: diaminopimelate decarboxylase [Bryobacterales bacterium]|nr:diaminopimelate decarboxylase [Bryobacterales bacterium]